MKNYSHPLKKIYYTSEDFFTPPPRLSILSLKC